MIRLIQLECDYKETFYDGGMPNQELLDAVSLVVGDESFGIGDNVHVHDYTQDEVDSNILYICSEELTPEQLDRLWKVGDLNISMVGHWDADNFEELIADIYNVINTQQLTERAEHVEVFEIENGALEHRGSEAIALKEIDREMITDRARSIVNEVHLIIQHVGPISEHDITQAMDRIQNMAKQIEVNVNTVA